MGPLYLPKDIDPLAVRRLSFTCCKYPKEEMELGCHGFRPPIKETHPDSLSVTVEQISRLKVRAGFFETDSAQSQIVRRTDREVSLKIPEALEIGQTYTLVVTSDNLTLSACLIKDEKKANREEFLRRARKMGEVLIEEGIQNLELAARGGRNVFDASVSSTADIFARGMQEVIRAGQQMHPEIRVPQTRPSESAAALDELTVDELQRRFEVTFIEDKKLESQHLQAARTANIEEMNKIFEIELANSQLLINLAEALKRKGVKAQIPQSEAFQAAAKRSAEDRVKALKKAEEDCTVQ